MKIHLTCLLLVLGIAALRAATVDAVCKDATEAEFAPPGSASFSALKPGQVLPIGSTVRTDDDGSAVLQTTPGSAIKLGPGSALRINDLAFAQSHGNVTERKARLQLTSGAVSAMIDPGTPKITDFKIQTPQGVAAARGTFYAVTIAHGHTYVSVNRGKVGVLAAQE
jgi:hypothetical protein